MKVKVFLGLFLVSWLLVFSQQAFAQISCYNTTSNPKRTDGLLTTPSFQSGSKFGAQPQNYLSGACVTNNAQAALPSFQLPTYDQLKNQYYDRSTLSATVKPAPLSSLSIGELNSYLTQPDSLLYVSSNLTLSGTASGTGSAVIFVQGNLNINNDFIYNNNTGGIVFVVSGNIYIYSSANRVDAFLVAGGNIYTGSPNGGNCTNNSQAFTPAGAGMQQLVVNGSLISVNPSTLQTIFFCRKLGNNNNPAEQINYQTKYSVVLQNLMSSPQNIQIPSGDYKIGTPQTGLPDCQFVPVCTGVCSAPPNTCVSGAGTASSCSLTQLSGGSTSCTKVAAPNQPCTASCSAGQTCSSGACITVFPSSGLISYWNMDENDPNAIDRGSNNNGNASAGVSVVPGKISNGRSFNGGTGQLTIQKTASLSYFPALTVSGWVKPTNCAGGPNPHNTLFTQQYGFLLAFDPSCRVANYMDPDGIGGWYGPDGNNGVVTANSSTWSHMVMTWDGSTIRSYLNGSLISGSGRATSGTWNMNSSRFFIGRRNDCVGCEQALIGVMDEVGIWNRVLSSGEITTLFNGGSGLTYNGPSVPRNLNVSSGNNQASLSWQAPAFGTATSYKIYRGTSANSYSNIGTTTSTSYLDNTVTDGSVYYYRVTPVDASSSEGPITAAAPLFPGSGLISYWKLDDGPGTTASDFYNSNTGSATNTTVVGGKIGNARSFNNTATSLVNIPNTANLANFPSLTVSAWVNPVNCSGLGGHNTVVGQEAGLLLAFDPSCRISNYVSTNGTWRGGDGNSAILPLNQWSLMVVTWDGSTIRSYLNGALISGSGTAAVGTWTNSGSAYNIGNRFGNQTLNGSVDEVGIWNRTLSASEISLLYSAGSGLTYDGSSAPRGFSVSNSGTTNSLSWQAPAGLTPTTYKLYRSTSPTSGYSCISGCSSNSTALSYNDAGLTVGTMYYYRVSAVDSRGFESTFAQVAKGIPVTYTIAAGYSGTQGPCTTGSTCWYYKYQVTGGTTLGDMVYNVNNFGDNNWHAPGSAWGKLGSSYHAAGDASAYLLYWKAPTKGIARVTVTQSKNANCAGCYGNGYYFGLSYADTGVGTWPKTNWVQQYVCGSCLGAQTISWAQPWTQQLYANQSFVYHIDPNASDSAFDDGNYTLSIEFTPN
jgi:hypothetical protein